jgi:hypothetical protein
VANDYLYVMRPSRERDDPVVNAAANVLSRDGCIRVSQRARSAGMGYGSSSGGSDRKPESRRSSTRGLCALKRRSG